LNTSFDSLAAYRWQGFNLTGGDQPERITGRRVSSQMLSVLGVAPAIGRDFAVDEDREGASRVAIFSDSLWKRRLGADPSAVGKTLKREEEPYEGIGGLPADFHYFSNADILTTMEGKKGQWLAERSWHPGIQVVARLKPGVNIAKARADMTSIAGALGQE